MFLEVRKHGVLGEKIRKLFETTLQSNQIHSKGQPKMIHQLK